MLIASLVLVLSVALLIWSADKFVDGASGVAKYYKLSPLLIGMVIVGFGTSAPELLVSVMASINGESGIAIGNVIGSNICNVGLILGVTMLIKPIVFSEGIVKKELVYMALLGIPLALITYGGLIHRLEGLFLLIFFSFFMYKSFKDGTVEVEETKDSLVNIKSSSIALVVGLVLLMVSSKGFIWSSVSIARALGVDELVIGLTLVALGTSLPELASSIMAARKGENEMALGNIIGSNMFNILMVLGTASLISPLKVPAGVMPRDIIVMTIFAVVLLLSAFIKKDGIRQAGRGVGLVLVGLYVAYSIFLFMQ